jgi:hypothetical protein
MGRVHRAWLGDLDLAGCTGPGRMHRTWPDAPDPTGWSGLGRVDEAWLGAPGLAGWSGPVRVDQAWLGAPDLAGGTRPNGQGGPDRPGRAHKDFPRGPGGAIHKSCRAGSAYVFMLFFYFLSNLLLVISDINY